MLQQITTLITGHARDLTRAGLQCAHEHRAAITLAGHFLIAMPNLADPPFSRGVALLCQHDEDGAVGLLVNQLSEYRFGDVLAQMKLECWTANWPMRRY